MTNPQEQIISDERAVLRKALTHCLQVLDMAAGEGLHYSGGGEIFDAGDAVFELAKALGIDIANVGDVPGLLVSALLSTPPAQSEASTLPGEVVDAAGHAADAVRDQCLQVLGKVISFDDSSKMADGIIAHVRSFAPSKSFPPTTPAVESGEVVARQLRPYLRDPEIAFELALVVLAVLPKQTATEADFRHALAAELEKDGRPLSAEAIIDNTENIWCDSEQAIGAFNGIASRPVVESESADRGAEDRKALAERVADAVAVALAKYAVAYSHVTLIDMSTAGRSWKVHETGHGNPFDHDVWLGEFDNKADANALVAKLRRDAAIEAVRAALAAIDGETT